MKKILSFAVCLISLAVLIAVPASADNRVSDMDITAVMNTDGSVDITAVWSGRFTEGTECYIPVNTEGGLDIVNLAVSDGTGQFERVSSWDIDLSREQKRGRCGLNPTDGGYEICWGIGDYGDNTYTVSYTVTGVVGSYSDSDGFNFMFVNRGMNTGPTSVCVRLLTADGTALDKDNCKCWAFGFEGQIAFDSGAVKAYTTDDIDQSGGVIIMLEFEKGIFSPARSVDGSFRDVKEAAFKDSDYSYYYDEDGNFTEGVYGYSDAEDNSDWIALIIVVAAFAVAGLVMIGVAVFKIVRKCRFNRFVKDADYFRDTPCGGNLDLSYALGRVYNLCGEGAIVGARIMQMLEDGSIEILTDKTVGAFGREKAENTVHFVSRPENDCQPLYDLMVAAAGDDCVLSRREMEKYCNKHPARLRNFITDAENRGALMLDSRCYKAGYNLKQLSGRDMGRLRELVGYKKYLTDFSLIGERGVAEVTVWREMLIFATLFGIADEVAKQLKQVYPKYVPEIETVYYHSTFAYGYYRVMYHSMVTREQQIRAQQAQRSIGSGGSSSFGGGGGFSGGGFGGGTR